MGAKNNASLNRVMATTLSSGEICADGTRHARERKRRAPIARRLRRRSGQDGRSARLCRGNRSDGRGDRVMRPFGDEGRCGERKPDGT